MTSVLTIHAERPTGPDLAALGRAPLAAWLGALRADDVRVAKPGRHGEYAIRSVHEAAYLDFLRFAPSEQPDRRICAWVHPGDDMTRVPSDIAGRAGVFLADSATSVGVETWDDAQAGADVAVEGALRLIAGDPAVVALSPMPGRHAFGARAARRCYLNNAAIAASLLREHFARLAVVSLGRHHANGTQSIFRARDDILTVSVHCDPAHAYPFYTGYAGEIGEGDGQGSNLNLPLPVDGAWGSVGPSLRLAFAAVEAFAPEAVILDFGLDPGDGEPVAGGMPAVFSAAAALFDNAPSWPALIIVSISDVEILPILSRAQILFK